MCLLVACETVTVPASVAAWWLGPFLPYPRGRMPSRHWELYGLHWRSALLVFNVRYTSRRLWACHGSCLALFLILALFACVAESTLIFLLFPGWVHFVNTLRLYLGVRACMHASEGMHACVFVCFSLALSLALSHSLSLSLSLSHSLTLTLTLTISLTLTHTLTNSQTLTLTISI